MTSQYGFYSEYWYEKNSSPRNKSIDELYYFTTTNLMRKIQFKVLKIVQSQVH